MQVFEHTALQFSWLDIRIWKLNYGARVLLKCLLLNQIDFWLFDQIFSSFIILIISQNSFNFAITVASIAYEIIVVPGLWLLILFLSTFPIIISITALSQHYCLLVFYNTNRSIPIVNITFDWIIMFMLSLKMWLLKRLSIIGILDFFLLVQACNTFIIGMFAQTVL